VVCGLIEKKTKRVKSCVQIGIEILIGCIIKFHMVILERRGKQVQFSFNSSLLTETKHWK
jgi:hypothetical protein